LEQRNLFQRQQQFF